MGLPVIISSFFIKSEPRKRVKTIESRQSTRPEFNFIGNEGHYVAPFKMGHFVEQESAAMEEIST